MTAKKAKAAVRQVPTLVNGQAVGYVPDTSLIHEAAASIARAQNIRSFTLKIDGKKVTDVNRTLKGAKSIELVTKDARG